MKMNWIGKGTFATVVALLLSTQSGIAADTLDQKPAPLPPVIVIKATASGTAFGGEGGGPFETACPANYVMTGISVSNYVAATNWYNAGLAITCTQVGLTSKGELKLETSSVKKAAFVWASFTANKDSLCSSGGAITAIRVFANGTGFVQDVGANCKTFPTEAFSEVVSAANSPTWDGDMPSLSSCAAGSFGIGIYGRNGEGIDKLGVRCGTFSVDYPKAAVFESKFPMDLIPTTPSTITKSTDSVSCSVGSFAYLFPGVALKDAQPVDLDSVTVILKSGGAVLGSASSDDYKNLPKWLLGMDNTSIDGTYAKGVATWKTSNTAGQLQCLILAYKDHQMTYVSVN